MSEQSKHVKNWRKRTKERIILAMGGKCVCCGYDKCSWALVLHHLDPNEKDFHLGSIRANSISWNRITNELKKCILVCHNCHTEIHYGIRDIPENPARFNETFLNYKELEIMEREKDPTRYHNCPYCNMPVPNYKKYCSKICASACNGKKHERKTIIHKTKTERKTKIIWPSHELLTKMLEESNFSSVGRVLGVSDNAIRKRLKRKLAGSLIGQATSC